MPTITRRPFPTRLAILPSSEYLFAQARDAAEINAVIVAERTLSNGLEVLAVNYGLLAFDFAKTPLGSFEVLEQPGGGVIAESVSENREQLILLQGQRMQMAIFVAACILARHSFLTHAALRSPRYPGLDQIYGWLREPDNKLGMPVFEYERLLPHMQERRLAAQRRFRNLPSIPIDHFEQGIDLADRLLAAGQASAEADYVALIVMNYQAAILHQRQHAGASIALAAVIIEVALQELLFVFGLVNGSTAKPYAVKAHTCVPVTRTEGKKLGFEKLVAYLKDGGLISRYLAADIDEIRKARNVLMHRGADAQPKQSGKALTVVRDVLRLLTGEEFEMITPWGYRT